MPYNVPYRSHKSTTHSHQMRSTHIAHVPRENAFTSYCVYDVYSLGGRCTNSRKQGRRKRKEGGKGRKKERESEISAADGPRGRSFSRDFDSGSAVHLSAELVTLFQTFNLSFTMAMDARHWVLMVAEMRRFPQMSYKADIIVLSGNKTE